MIYKNTYIYDKIDLVIIFLFMKGGKAGKCYKELISDAGIAEN